MSDFEDPREDSTADIVAREPAATGSVAGDSSAAAPVNPRKRKKSSRACDFCHVNHQPCDNAKPRCSYCERHNKSCLYLRPQKKRGPAQGYRSALHTLRESAAAWGAALNLIPSLGPVVEGYLKQPEGRRLIKVIKDPTQQEFFIQAWQQSGVFKTFFGDEASEENPSTTPDGAPTSALTAPTTLSIPQPPESSDKGHIPPESGSVVSPPPPQLTQAPQLDNLVLPKFESNPFNFGPSPSPSSQDGTGRPRQPSMTGRSKQRTESISFSDIVARDAARSSQGFSQTLGSLGFAPTETLEDFLDMTFNPEPVDQPVEQDTLLGSEDDQKAYYELLMGRRFG
ncbi:Quinic acid utilization activator [Cytospora mali]|uniref:Quinic acid utilization activator n=1 Tax=Cytospora mali TaxID=578113 RepID=A0A194VVT1_CYTMA|nr:Quinic acid utilization activator [Valsa mali]